MLREKKDELSRLVLSRKRKLSELYYATVNQDGFPPTPNSPQYQEKERLFLEANDIQRGRHFDISTLPRQHQFTDPQRPGTPSKTFHSPQVPTETRTERSIPSTSPPPSTIPPKRLVGPASRPTTPTHVNGGEQELGERDESGNRTRSPDKMPPRRIVKTKSSIPVSEADSRRSFETEDDTGQRVMQGNKDTGDGSDGAAGNAGREEAVQRRSGSPTVFSSAGKPRREPSPPNLASQQQPADPQSSPASSDGAGSSNTLGVTVASPTTSPGEEPISQKEGNLPGESRGPATTNTVVSQISSSSSTQKAIPLSSTASMPPPTEAINGANQSNLTPRPPIYDSSRPSTIRRPVMRIDTQSTTQSTVGLPKTAGSVVDTPMSFSGTITPRKPPATPSTQSPPGRITRISSGTIRHKSVSEILGEIPKPSTPSAERTAGQNAIPTPTKEDQDTFTGQANLADRKERDKDRSKLSTVVFVKPLPPVDIAPSGEVTRRISTEVTQNAPEERDYLHTLFESKASSPPRGQSLNTLLQSAHKALSTSDHFVDYQEQMNCRTLKRIYQLQNVGRWSLRQMQRAAEPVRPTSHWDFLLNHVKWMRTDFREERKWKMAAARGVAEWCAEWVASSPKRRRMLQIRARPQRTQPLPQAEETQTADQSRPDGTSAQPTPDLIPSAEDESVTDGYADEVLDIRLSAPPAAIFSLGPSEFSFPLDKTPAMDKLLNELPFYEPAQLEPDLSHSHLAESSDARWKTDIVPVSKFTTQKIQYHVPPPPAKRSRYDYAEERSRPSVSNPLPPKQANVALFMPENKHIRDRIHPGHSFRPPTEYPMPAQAFFESRNSSQWTQVEDDELRKLVKEYSYNWSLISTCLSTTSPFHSGADRRTPWECFERWINLEGLPADMSKTPYFRAYHSRIEAAGRHVLAQQEAAQRREGVNPALTPRKRTTQPIRVERKRNQRYLPMIDAMRKLAKKRETAFQKQTHAAELAAMRKAQAQAQEPDRQRTHLHTPAEFQRIKFERDSLNAARQEDYRQRMLAGQKAVHQRTAQMNHANGIANGARPGQGVPNGGLAGASAAGLPHGLPGANGLSHASRQMPGMPGLPNGIPSNGPASSNMVPKGYGQPPMQAGLGAGRGLGSSPEHMRILYEANRLQQQQQMMLAARQHVQHQQQGSTGSAGQHSSPNMPNAGMAGNANSNSPAFVAAMAASNGVPSPSGQMVHANVNGMANAGSPRVPNGHSLSSGITPAISQLAANIQRMNPELSPEDVQRAATNQLMTRQAAHSMSQKSMNQAALNAAAGAANAGAHAANASSYGRPQGIMTNEQVQAYNTQLRQQQAAQRAGGGYGAAGMAAGLGMNMNGNVGPMGAMAGFTGSPVLSMSRPVSNHAGSGQMSRSATPRDQRGGSTGGMGQGSPGRGGQGQV